MPANKKFWVNVDATLLEDLWSLSGFADSETATHLTFFTSILAIF